jgi:3-hydroxybutyryl-CoA dehydratase
VTEADIVMFAGVSGDTNPVHTNQPFAEQTMFKGRIAHGMLSAAFISTALGTRLPGPGCVYLSQTLNFKAPVKVGDTVVARVTVREIDPVKRRVLLDTLCLVDDKVVLEGEARLMVSSRDATLPKATNGGSESVVAAE